MKTNIRLLFTACAAALVTGCTNLDVDVESQYTEYPTNEIAVEAKMADVRPLPHPRRESAEHVGRCLRSGYTHSAGSRHYLPRESSCTCRTATVN